MFDRLITFHARLSPDAVAFEIPGGQVGYAAFDADIDRVAAVLAPTITPGADALAAVRIANPYAHWLVLMALARLGIASTTPAPERTPTLLVTDTPQLEHGHGRDWPVVHVSREWLEAALQRPRPMIAPAHPAPEALGRVLFSSGTTGRRKAIGLSWGRLQARAYESVVIGSTVGTRTMPLLGVDTSMGLMSCLYRWTMGGTVIYGPPDLAALGAALATLKPDSLAMATGQLAALLDLLPEGFAMPDTEVFVAGGLVSRALAKRSLARFGRGLTIVYGSTEAGGATAGRAGMLDAAPDAVGWAYPGREVEIIDADGRPTPAGMEGEIRIRGPHVATSYLDDPNASATVFRNGWFHPGDLGRLLPDGLLCVAGRIDEVMNLGGVKVLPARFEVAALACPGVRDAAAFAMAAPGGGQRAHVAIVRGDGFVEPALVRALVDAVPGVMAPILVWVDAIPRNAMAKPDRAGLIAAVAAVAATA